MKPWKAEWFRRARQRREELWRGVEAQHMVATMRLADSLEEQRLLEDMLDASKPALPAHAAGRHPLIATPFRYLVPFASRFRRADEAGVWYGASGVRTCCAEIAYWRWRFVTDSDGLRDAAVHTQHTLFPATARGLAIDLDAPPWNALEAQWTADRDYAACQALAEAARDHAVEWIRYRSVRDPAGHCGAVLTATALGDPDLARQETWHCRTTRTRVSLVREFADGFEFEASAWQ